MPVKYRRISTQKVRKIARYFCEYLTATQTTRLVGVQRNTVNRWYDQFRLWIAEFQEEQARQSSGEFELDESYFGGIKKKNHADERRKRGRGAENKVPVFGIKKRDDGTVYTQIIENASKATLMPIVKRLIHQKDSVVYTDGWRGYDGLVFNGYKHQRVNHSKHYSNKKGTHINGIENFWGFSKQRLAKFHGLSRKTFYLHLKECEFRYNKRRDMMKLLEKKLREMVL
jgi:transposase-like protein